jgi:hypothetical protein
MSLSGYSLRSGCCFFYDWCCDDNGEIVDYDCCCRIYSVSLQGSNDNVTWTVLHKIEKDERFDSCIDKTFNIQETQSYRYVRLVQEEPAPGCRYCMCLNQVEFYGKVSGIDVEDAEEEIEEEPVSIIGKIKKEGRDNK